MKNNILQKNVFFHCYKKSIFIFACKLIEITGRSLKILKSKKNLIKNSIN